MAFSLNAGVCLAGDADEIVERLKARYLKITSIEAEFRQEVKSKAGLGAGGIADGKVFFKRPGKMRWIYSETGDEIISNGKILWFFQPELNQAIERPSDSGITIATDFLSGIEGIGRDFDISLKQGADDIYTLLLQPRKAMEGIKAVAIQVDKRDFFIKKTVVSDHLNNETTVEFKNIKTDAKIKDEFFEFKTPKGVLVVRP